VILYCTNICSGFLDILKFISVRHCA